MSPQEADKLMENRGFSLGATTGFGIRLYSYSDIEKTPRVIVQVIPERDEFKIIYKNNYSANSLETPWCSPLRNKQHFRKMLIGVKRWARKIEELYEEE